MVFISQNIYPSLVIIIFSAYILDFFIGDPLWLPHPVRWIGRYIVFLERRVRIHARTPEGERTGGILLFLAVVLTVFIILWLILAAASHFSIYLSYILSTYIAFTALSTRSLHDEARSVIGALQDGAIEDARRRLSFIVGRDTNVLSREEICTAVTETVAENTSDGIVAPLLFLTIGGPVLALTYKAVNTLDSMVGYRDEHYRHIGWFSARMDDIANYIPSRLTAFLMIAASFFLNLDWRCALRVVWMEGRCHLSPNAGYPEAAAAGALRVSLGGGNRYSGRFVGRPVIGRGLSVPDAASAIRAINLMKITSFLMLIAAVAVSFLWKMTSSYV